MKEEKSRYHVAKRKKSSTDTFRRRQNKKKTAGDGLIRLNKHIAHSGICSRRDADKFIEAGVVSVNGRVITKMGYKVKEGDIVKFNNSTINASILSISLKLSTRLYLKTIPFCSSPTKILKTLETHPIIEFKLIFFSNIIEPNHSTVTDLAKFLG